MVTAERSLDLQVHDHDADEDHHDSEEREEQVHLEQRLPETPLGARLDDGPDFWPPDGCPLIHHVSVT